MQRAKSIKPSKKQSQRAAPRKQSKKNGNKPPNDIPSGYGGLVRSPVRVLSDRYPSHDTLIVLTSAIATTAGAQVRIPCNPRLWPNTSALARSLAWQTYRPNSIRVRWIPGVGTTTAGMITMGTLLSNSTIPMAQIPNALMASRGAVTAPIWGKDTLCEMDLTGLTQPRYFLNSIEDDGVPACIYVILPSTATGGMLEVHYDISFFSPSTGVTNVPVYDLIPRSITTPANLTTAYHAVSSTSGLVVENIYSFITACAPAIASNVQLTSTSGGGGSVAIDTGIFNLNTNCKPGSGGFYIYEQDTTLSLYLNSAPMENLVTWGWVSGPN